MLPTPVIIVTGHPATGKTTLAVHLAERLGLPLVSKDQIKEPLADVLGWSTPEWSRKLSAATWALLYRQVEALLRANVAHIAEANFTPVYADSRWQSLAERYALSVVQVRCETAFETLFRRYCERIDRGQRHPVHVDQRDDAAFVQSLREGPLGWVAIAGEQIAFDTTMLTADSYAPLVGQLRDLLADG